METVSRETLEPLYVTGLVDGQGSFTYSRSGKQIALYFALKCASADEPLLEDVQAFFEGAGRIYRVGTTSSYYRVSRRDELMRVIEHFDAFPLRTTKRHSYDIWRQMVHAKQDFRKPDRTLLSDLALQLSALVRPSVG